MATINTHDRQPDVPAHSEYHTSAFTLPNGCPIDNPYNSEKVQQKNGNTYKMSQLLQDTYNMDQIAHLSRERIPERFGHAKGCGAYGEFTVTSDEIQNYTCADFLSAKGKKTPLFSRLSTTSAFRGSADTVRDTRGFAFKLYTEEGNLDWVFFWPGVFSIWDVGKIISNNHATKKCPATGMADPNMHFDFVTKNREALNSSIRLHSDDGTPRRFNDITIGSLNTYTFVKDAENYSYVRITLVPAHEIHTPFTNAEAAAQAGVDSDYHIRRLYKQISKNTDKEAGYKSEIHKLTEQLQKGNLSKDEQKKLWEKIQENEQNIEKLVWPEWKVVAQIIQPEDVENVKVNILDASKVFPKDQNDIIKTIEFGRLRLNRIPRNQFAEVEQAAFCAANIVPGWDITPDPMLQARIFAYPDTQRHRLGVNAEHLPVNRPKRAWNPLRRDGPNSLFNYEDVPTYVADYKQTQALPGTRTASSFANPDPWTETSKSKVPRWDSGIDVTRGLNEWGEQDPLEQPRDYYFNELAGPAPEKHRDPQYVAKAEEKGIDYRQWALVENYAQHLHGVRWDIRLRTYGKSHAMRTIRSVADKVEAMFFEMDTVNREGKWPTKKNLGHLIRERTVELITASKHAEDSDDEDEEGLPRYASIPSLEVSRALGTATNPYPDVSLQGAHKLPDHDLSFLPN